MFHCKGTIILAFMQQLHKITKSFPPLNYSMLWGCLLQNVRVRLKINIHLIQNLDDRTNTKREYSIATLSYIRCHQGITYRYASPEINLCADGGNGAPDTYVPAGKV